MIEMQNYERLEADIRKRYLEVKKEDPERFSRRLDMSWSNWGFGLEDLEVSCQRLQKAGLEYVELHGNHYGSDLGYKVEDVVRILDDAGLKASGVCGMYGDENDFSSNRPVQQQAAIDYTRRELDFCAAVSAEYLLVVPGAVGRPDPYDASEFERSVDALRRVAPAFDAVGVKGAIEPIRSAEVSLVHTVDESIRYIKAVDSPGVQWINGDVYHMQSDEVNIADAVLRAGERLVNLHLADSNRRALGEGAMNFDAIIMALYLIGMNEPGRYVTPEPLGPGAGPYVARNGIPDAERLDRLVFDSVKYFQKREQVVRSMT